MVARAGATSGRAGSVMVCGPVCTVTTWGLVRGTSGRVGTVMVCGCVCGGCRLWLGGHGHGVVVCVGATSDRAGSVMVCGPVCTAIVCGLVDVIPAAGWARPWCVVVCAAGGRHVRPGGHGHGVVACVGTT